MNIPKHRPSNSTLAGLALALALAAAAPSAHANVYASNVKINGGMTNLAVAQGTGVNISYILNEPASAGVTIKILSGATAVRTISIVSGAGTTRGTNTAVWDGKADGGANAPGGNYSVSITAASTGYSGWTKITDDNNIGNYVYDSCGIAVDRNTNRPYYGRVFVGNSYAGPGSSLGDLIGVQKLNADGSYADEGGFSDGGVAWNGQSFGPWKIRVSDDDYVYVEDIWYYGDIYRFDGTISSNSMLYVFAAPTDGSLGNWNGFWLVGQGTNTVLWAADAYGTFGISKFFVKPDGTFDPSAGTQVVGVSASSGMDVAPYSVALDKAGNIYTLQSQANQGYSDALVFRFPAYDPSTNSGLPEYAADWVAGPGDDYCGAHGIAVDPTGTYVAACFWGYGDNWYNYTSGNIKILNAADGTIVTNLDLGVSYPSGLTSDPTHHMDTDADWDAVGNLYYLDDWPGCWRAFSPPGTNQATTVALANVQVTVSVAPTTLRIAPAAGNSYAISYSGGGGSQFVLLTSPTVNAPLAGWARAATNIAPNGVFSITPSARTFYRVKSE